MDTKLIAETKKKVRQRKNNKLTSRYTGKHYVGMKYVSPLARLVSPPWAEVESEKRGEPIESVILSKMVIEI